MEQQPQTQIYDATLKALFGQEVADILPNRGAETGDEGGIEDDLRIFTAIKKRFPTLLAKAQPQIEQIKDPDALGALILQLASVSDEDEVRKLLHIRKVRSKRKE